MLLTKSLRMHRTVIDILSLVHSLRRGLSQALPSWIAAHSCAARAWA